MKEDEVILLARNGLFNGKRLRGEIEETHISWVVLCKSVVFKIKKPIKLSFLDFSDLGKRKEKCEREILLNRRFTNIYQRVVPIRRSGSIFIVAGNNGKIVDYAVQLKRLATARRMDKVLKDNRVSIKDIVTLARTISDSHKKCEIVKKPFVLVQARNLFNDISAEAEFIAEHAGPSYRKIITKSIHWSDRFLDRHRQRLRQRIASGFRRDVHGDLHSGNIFIYRKPVIFDCIEFNDSFREIDVLYEIAFLCMDLEKFGKKRLAGIFFSEYSKRFNCVEDAEDIRIFNYFKCLRASIRVKVHVMGMKQSENDEERRPHLAEIRKYLLLMKRYMLSDQSFRDR